MTTSALPKITVASTSNGPPRASLAWSHDTIDRALAETPSDLELPDKNGDTALHALINGLSSWDLGDVGEEEDARRVHAILGLRNISLINRGNAHSMTPVYLAAMNRATSLDFRKEILQALLEAKADPNLAGTGRWNTTDSDEENWWTTCSATPLFNALRLERPEELIQLLIAYGGKAVCIKTDSDGKRADPMSLEELGQLATLTESVRQMCIRPLQGHLGQGVAGIVAAYAYPKGPK